MLSWQQVIKKIFVEDALVQQMGIVTLAQGNNNMAAGKDDR